MKSRPASVRLHGGLDRVDSAVRLLEEEWRRYGEVRLEEFWAHQVRDGAADPIDPLVLLAALVKADLRLRFDQGQTPTAAGYLRVFPELLRCESRVLSLVYEEYCLSEERGRVPDADSFCERYPELKSALASQLRYHRVFSKAAGINHPLPRFPEPGEDFEEFHLLSDLGRGGTSRVFLARDRSLGGKQVALKVTLDRGQEPKVQGALDHPHIVPVNAVIYPTEGSLCGLSMPFRPGLPLDEVIRRVNPAERPTRAMALWDVLDHDDAGGSNPTPGGAQTKREANRRVLRPGPRGDGWDGFPARGTYAQGVAWVVMILARALQYAHSKLTYHRDVKPANVLLTLVNGPQLLDFNLAESPHSADRAQAALRGGTPPYMAPEQLEAFLNPELQDRVAAQADVYSLGLVLRELLTGQMPEMPAKGLSPSRELLYLLDRRPLLDVAVRRMNPAIPHSLAAIVTKCLAFAPEHRYSSAESLARDLERFLGHQPLLQAANPSRVERLRNWATRNRRLLAGAACVMVVGGLVSVALNSGVSLTGPSGHRQKQAFKPPLESVPLFRSAVNDATRGLSLDKAEQPRSPELERAVGTFLKLEKDYPQSSLIKLYLSLTYDGLALGEKDKKKDESKKFLSKALLAALDDERSLVEWAKDHPEIADNLVELIFADIIRVDQYASDYDADIPSVDEEERDQLLKRTSYDLAKDALPLAAKLGPDSPEIQFLFAKTEEFSGEFAQAHARLTQLINAASSNAIRQSTLFYCRQLRPWVTCLWVEHERDSHTVLDERALRLLEEAQADLEIYRRFLGNYYFKDKAIKEYRALHDKARLTLTQAEVDVDRENRTAAEKHVQASKKMIDRLNDLGREAEKSHLRIPKSATRLAERLDGVSRRLRAPGDGGRPSSRSLNQPAIVGSIEDERSAPW
jgi:serine/threonine protein kinase